jgi:hypothetical protein
MRSAVESAGSVVGKPRTLRRTGVRAVRPEAVARMAANGVGTARKSGSAAEEENLLRGKSLVAQLHATSAATQWGAFPAVTTSGRGAGGASTRGLISAMRCAARRQGASIRFRRDAFCDLRLSLVVE